MISIEEAEEVAAGAEDANAAAKDSQMPTPLSEDPHYIATSTARARTQLKNVVPLRPCRIT